MNIKKFFMVLVLACTVGIGMSHAQKMEKGMSLVNVGVGFVPGVGANLSYDYGLVNTWGPGIFTIGGFVGFASWGDTYGTGIDYRENDWVFAPRATYRYGINESFEVYGTVMLGAHFTTFSEYYGNSSGVFFGTTAGCRYSFSKNLSVFAEVGYSVSVLNGGLSFAF